MIPLPILRELRDRGRLTVARFMELALYDPDVGYYAKARHRSGRAGDFYTSVDVGPLFGACLSQLIGRAWDALGRPASFDVVEAGASDGRLARDLLDALLRENPSCYRAIRLTLVERSPTARAAQSETLAAHDAAFSGSGDELPRKIRGVLYANELLDALPVHRVRMTPGGLVEVFVAEASNGGLALVEGPLSTAQLLRFFDDLGISLEPGSVADVNLAALGWCHVAAESLERGYLLLVDYGHEASRLYGGVHAAGTLRAYVRHMVDPAASSDPAWLAAPGDRDLTSHVDFTAAEAALARAGLVRHASVEQTRLLIALGLAERLMMPARDPVATLRMRLAAKTLVSPEGLGGSHRALLMGTSDAAALGLPFDAPWTAPPSL